MRSIVHLIGVGKSNATSVSLIQQITHLNTRQIRNSISKSRRDYPIINLQDGKGYYIATEDDSLELAKWIRQEEKRAKKVLLSLRGAKRLEMQIMNINQTRIKLGS